MTYNQRQSVSNMLMLSMLFSLWVAVAPMTPAHAKPLDTVKNNAKAALGKSVAVAAGLAGSALGWVAAVSIGGAIGTTVGAVLCVVVAGVASYMIAKRIMLWATGEKPTFNFMEQSARAPEPTFIKQSASAPEPTKAESAASPVVKGSQTAYRDYQTAYKRYVDAVQKGDAALAKSASAEYKTNLDLYNSLIKSGK